MGMVTPGGPPLDPSKPVHLITFDPFWVVEALGNISTSIVSNSHFGKRPVARDTTIFKYHFLPNVTNKYFLINEIFVSRAPGHLRG